MTEKEKCPLCGRPVDEVLITKLSDTKKLITYFHLENGGQRQIECRIIEKIDDKPIR